VLGVGVEGRTTIDYLLETGVTDVTALDRNEIEGLPAGVASVFGEAHDRELGRFASIFRSPGIRPDHPSLIRARESGCRVTSAISHFLERCPAPAIGVTGTVGKGTAASLIAAMLEESGFTTHLGGNIGASPLGFLSRVASGDRVVLEISSFQAIDLASSPHVGVILKTTSEHLDWHLDHEEYLRAKAGLLAHQTRDDTVVVNADSHGAIRVAAAAPGRRLGYSLEKSVDRGLAVAGDRFVFDDGDGPVELPLDPEGLRLPGRFNLENVAAALLASHAVGAGWDACCRAASRFEGLPHRLELVAEAGGIRFYNDSYATRPEAALGALSCFPSAPLALILGGSEKHADFGELAAAVVAHPQLAHVALIGATADRLAAAIRGAGPCRAEIARYADLEPAMEGAAAALPGEGVLLLAPACASFGLFPNYKVRGERFRSKARELAAKIAMGPQ
jgi:UDP-N-acetylmuramoylalanine--D-glutamate ligase